jgi:hypothetical protein
MLDFAATAIDGRMEAWPELARCPPRLVPAAPSADARAATRPSLTADPSTSCNFSRHITDYRGYNERQSRENLQDVERRVEVGGIRDGQPGGDGVRQADAGRRRAGSRPPGVAAGYRLNPAPLVLAGLAPPSRPPEVRAALGCSVRALGSPVPAPAPCRAFAAGGDDTRPASPHHRCRYRP